VLILGFGKEGASTYRVLSRVGGYARLDIADRGDTDIDAPLADAVFTGSGYTDALDGYDIVFKSPGVVVAPEDVPRKCLVTSQTDIFLGVYGSQTVGVTGTKGKSTVSTMIYHVLRENGKDCLLAGNIGTPVFDVFESVSRETILVLELSCHQLEYCRRSPHTALFLNLYEDHLDHYGTFARYARAKANIYAHQSLSDTLICPPEFNPGGSRAHKIFADTPAAAFIGNGLLESAGLRGEHSRLNCAFAYLACSLYGVDETGFARALGSYRALAHRLEFLGAMGGADYYDDSISTTAESAVSAVKSVPNAQVLLVGGMDRGIAYDGLAKFLAGSGLSYVILMYESGKRVYEIMRGLSPCLPRLILADDLYRAAELAKKLVAPGGACILSPAAASYGHFKNFEERGDVFRKLIFSETDSGAVYKNIGDETCDM
jgi:UDP-N-acetylmuramoylalanine--D-glutamate ligase